MKKHLGRLRSVHGLFGWKFAAILLALVVILGPWFLVRAIAGPVPDSRPTVPVGAGGSHAAENPAPPDHALFLPAIPKNSRMEAAATPTATGDVPVTLSATPTSTPTSTSTPTPTPTATSTADEVPTSPVPDWWDSHWRARFKFEVSGSGYQRQDAVAELTVNFTEKLLDAGLAGVFDDATLRVVETDTSDQVLDDNVPFQFDKAKNYEASTYAAGQLILLAEGQTGASQTRRFYVYFDTADNANGKTAASVVPRVQYDGKQVYEGQDSYKIRNENSTFYYHENGGGFAGLLDRQGYDWISFHPTGGSAGNYRGIPNVATDDPVLGLTGLFHPGYATANTSILYTGPLKITFRSKAGAGAWQKTWEIYPRYARMNLYQKPETLPYWFLYEGTPGGAIDTGDYYVLPDGVRRGIYTAMNGDLPGEEWIYYGDDALARVLYVVNHQEDDVVDCHYVMQDNMTVFGFGRDQDQSRSPKMMAGGMFTVGLVEETDHAAVAAQVRGSYRPLDVAAGAGQYGW
jgi:hypothetical protein